MRWTEVRLIIEKDSVPATQKLLEACDSLAVTLSDNADQAVLEPGPGETPLWPWVEVCGLFEATANRGHVNDALQAVGHQGDITWREVEDQDWERAWMDRFEPMQLGEKLWIVPSEMPPPNDPDAVIIMLDPGLAFGSGTHPTTALCLQWIDARPMQGLTVVDYGCGSGILGIAAALKGAQTVVCVDNDPQALEAVAENARRNGVTGQLTSMDPAQFAHHRVASSGAAIVLANILARPLINLATVLCAALAEDGALVLSGLLEEQHEAVAQAYHSSIPHFDAVSQDGWLRLDGARTGQPVE